MVGLLALTKGLLAAVRGHLSEAEQVLLAGPANVACQAKLGAGSAPVGALAGVKACRGVAHTAHPEAGQHVAVVCCGPARLAAAAAAAAAVAAAADVAVAAAAAASAVLMLADWHAAEEHGFAQAAICVPASLHAAPA